jgi:hypothetical protein
MANVFSKIATVTVGSGGTNTIDFTSIPNSYADLCIKISARTDRALVNDEVDFRINGNNSAIYSYKVLTSSGSALSSTGETSTTLFRNINNIPGASATTSTFGNTEIYFSNYTSSSNKSISMDSVGENNATSSYMDLSAGLFASSSAITSISLFPRIGPNFVQYTTATLYGIRAEI